MGGLLNMNMVRIRIVSVLLGVVVMGPCRALPGIQWQTDVAGLHEGYVQELGQGDTSWIPTFVGIETQAKVSIPNFPINWEISRESGDARQKCLFSIWKGIPNELKDRLRRLGVVEERGVMLKFRMPLRIAYAFHSVPSLPKQLALASVDTKLTKPYLLAVQPIENITHMQWMNFFDEGDVLHCRRFPGEYLLRKQTGALRTEPLYALDVVPQAGSLSAGLCLLFLAPDPNSKTLAISLSFHTFVDTDIVQLDVPTVNDLWQRMELPKLPRASLYKTAGIDDVRTFHQKLFPDLFPLLDYNPDLRNILHENCFGSLVDLERLLPVLRSFPTSLLFIADKGLRSRCKSSLSVHLTGDIVPLIDSNKLQGENGRLGKGILDALVRDAERYNAFAKALWQHVYNAIVRDISVFPQDPCSVQYAQVMYILDEDAWADKRLLLAAQANTCDQLKILSIAQNPSGTNYFGPQYVILPETAKNIRGVDRTKMQQLIALLYQHNYDRIVSLPINSTLGFLEKMHELMAVTYVPKVNMQQLDRYMIAEDTSDGKFSCEALVPPDWRSFLPEDIKNRFGRAILMGLRVLLSPIQDGALCPIEMTIPDTIFKKGILGFGASWSVQSEITRVLGIYFRDSFGSDAQAKLPQHYAYALFTLDPEKAPTALEWQTIFCYYWLKYIGGDEVSELAAPAPGIYLDKFLALSVIHCLQTCAEECIRLKSLDQICSKVELLLSAFMIIAQRFDFTCETGRFEGMLYLFASCAGEDPFVQTLPLKDRVHALMRIMTEMYFMDVFKESTDIFMGPHLKMTFREALGGMYGISGKEPYMFSQTPAVKFAPMLNAATRYGIKTAGQFPEIVSSFYAPYDGSPQNPKVQDACRRLMRLIMSPQAVINKLEVNPLCDATLEKFLREVHYLPAEQISVLLRGSDMRRQIIADMLLEYGYLVEKH
jgi:hypothetical protein